MKPELMSFTFTGYWNKAFKNYGINDIYFCNNIFGDPNYTTIWREKDCFVIQKVDEGPIIEHIVKIFELKIEISSADESIINVILSKILNKIEIEHPTISPLYFLNYTILYNFQIIHLENIDAIGWITKRACKDLILIDKFIGLSPITPVFTFEVHYGERHYFFEIEPRVHNPTGLFIRTTEIVNISIIDDFPNQVFTELINARILFSEQIEKLTENDY